MGYICVTRNGLSLVYRLYTLPLIVMHYSSNVKDNYWSAFFFFFRPDFGGKHLVSSLQKELSPKQML
jgi:hypothetical protein